MATFEHCSVLKGRLPPDSAQGLVASGQKMCPSQLLFNPFPMTLSSRLDSLDVISLCDENLPKDTDSPIKHNDTQLSQHSFFFFFFNQRFYFSLFKNTVSLPQVRVLFFICNALRQCTMWWRPYQTLSVCQNCVSKKTVSVYCMCVQLMLYSIHFKQKYPQSVLTENSYLL